MFRDIRVGYISGGTTFAIEIIHLAEYECAGCYLL
jgi:hypothetical protein